MPDTSIDTLQININANAVKANDALDNLVKKLDKLTTSLVGIDGSKLIGLASGVQKLGTAMQTMNAVKTTDLTRLAKNLSNLNSLDTSNLSGVSANISKIGTAISGLSGASQGVTQITELANGIKQLGYKSADKAVNNIPKLATAMKQLMKELSTAPKVSQNLIDMTNALARLARTGASSGKAAQSLSNSFTGIYKSSGFAVAGIKKVNARLTNLIRSIVPVVGLVKLIDFGKQAMEISSDLTEVQNVVDVTFGDYKQKIEDLASVSIPELGMSELSVKEIGSRFQAMGTAMGFSTEKMSDMSVELTRLTGDMASFYNVEQEDMGKALQSIFTGETEPMRKYGIDLTNATIQQYALSQGISTSVNKMTQLEKAQLRYNYVMAQTTAAHGDFIRTQDTWANQIRILKQNLQQLASIIGGTLINAFKPLIQAINSAMSHIIAFAQTVSNALGKIFGWKFEVGGGGITNDLETGASAADDIASGMGEAAANAKKVRSHLLAIDELNVYEPAEDSSTSGSSGSGLGNLGNAGGTSIGEWVQQDSIFKDFESDIDSLYKLGGYIGKVLTDMMNSIDWEKVYEKARNFGTGLADFLNGLISPELFGAVGRTIARALNTAIYAALAFGERFDWKDFGLSLATGLNEFFLTFDFESLAEAINVWVKGILDTIITFLEKTDWKMIGEKIGTFLAKLDFIDIGLKIGEALWKAINSGFELLSGMFNKAPFETVILSVVAFKAVWDKLIKVKVVPWINKITKALKGFGNTILALSGSQNALSALIADFSKLGAAVDVTRKAFANFQFGIENGNLFNGLSLGIKTIRDNLTGLQKGVITAVAGFAEFKIVSSSFEDIVNGSENVVSSITKIGVSVGIAAAAMYTALGPAGLAIAGITGVVGAINGINEAFDSIRAEEIGQSIKNAMTIPGGTPISEIAENFSNTMQSIGENFSSISEKSNELKNADSNIENTWLEIEKIETSMDAGVISVEEGSARLTELFGKLSSETSEKFDALEDTLLAAFGENGVLNDVFNRLGVSTENTTSTIIELHDKVEKRIEELVKLLAETDPSNPNYAIYKEELASLTTQTDELTNAMNDYETALSKIDYSSLFDAEGNLSTEALEELLEEISTATKNAQENVASSIEGIKTSLNEDLNYALKIGDIEGAAEIQEKLNVLPDALNLLKNDIALKAVEVTDAIQNDFIGRVENVIDEAINKWNEKSAVEKWFSGIFGPGSEGEYVKEAVDQQQKNINELSSAIEEALGELGTDGVSWASEAAEEIYGALFDSQYIHSKMGLGHYKYTLNENYKEIINGATEGVAELAGERGKDTVEGFNNGISDNTETTEKEAESWMNKLAKAIHDSIMKFGSPSKTAEEYGKWTVDGYNLGITNNQDSTRTAIENWMEIISTAMEEKWNEIKEWWNNTAFVSFFDESIIPNFGYDKWYKLLGEGMFLAIQDKWFEFKDIWDSDWMITWEEESVEPNFGYEKWDDFLSKGMFLAFSDQTKKFIVEWSKNIEKWWKENVLTMFNYEKWYNMLSYTRNAFRVSFEEIHNTINKKMEDSYRSVSDWCSRMISELDSVLSKIVEVSSAFASAGSIGVSYSINNVSVANLTPTPFATGGIVTRPTFSLVGESGPEAVIPLSENSEWISRVAEQIENRSSNGSDDLLREQNELLRQQNELLSYLADKEIIARIDTDRETITGLKNAGRRLGYSFT